MNSVGLKDVALKGEMIKTDSKISKNNTWNKRFDSCGYEFHTPSRFRKGDKVITPSVLWEGLVEHTTAHGLPDYAKARGKVTQKSRHKSDFVLAQRPFWLTVTI